MLITVQEINGSPLTALSDDDGFYSISVRTGIISVTASKAGYVTRGSTLDVSSSTVLNFSLTLSDPLD